MEINRNNYPVWITDFKDGVLSAHQEEELFLFLNENEDLQDEFEMSDSPVLHPDIYIRMNRDGLKKNFTDLNENQQEELMVAVIEGDIPGDEVENIMSIINGNRELSTVYQSLEKIKLLAQPVSYNRRRGLRRISINKRYSRVAWYVVSAVATLAIPVCLLIFIPGNQNNPGNLNPVSGLQAEGNTNSEYTAVPEITVNDEVTGYSMDRTATISTVNSDDNNTVNQQVDRQPVIEDPVDEQLTVPERNVIRIEPAPISSSLPISKSDPQMQLAEMIPVIIPVDADRNFNARKIAGAAINGVNKLLGWEMKLENEKDLNGNVNSIRFSSQLVTVDHKKKTGSD